MKKVVLGFMVLVISMSQAYAKIKLNKKQLETAKFACNYGKKVYINGDDTCFLFAAIAYKESSLGMKTSNPSKHHHSYGVFQNYVKTVQSRLKQQGVRKNYNQIVEMLKNRWNSAKFAELELKFWNKTHKGNLTRTLASYNAGYNWKKGQRYANDVIRIRNYFIKHYPNIRR